MIPHSGAVLGSVGIGDSAWKSLNESGVTYISTFRKKFSILVIERLLFRCELPRRKQSGFNTNKPPIKISKDLQILKDNSSLLQL